MDRGLGFETVYRIDPFGNRYFYDTYPDKREVTIWDFFPFFYYHFEFKGDGGDDLIGHSWSFKVIDKPSAIG